MDGDDRRRRPHANARRVDGAQCDETGGADDDGDPLPPAEARKAEEYAQLKMTPQVQCQRRLAREQHRLIRQDCEEKIAHNAVANMELADVMGQISQMRAISTHMREWDSLVLQVRTGREGATEARAYAAVARVAQVKAQQLSSELGAKSFNPEVFAKKLAVALGARREDDDEEDAGRMQIPSTNWAAFGRRHGHRLNRPPPFSYLIGCMKAEAPVQRLKKERAAPSEKKSQTVLQGKAPADREMTQEATTAKEVDTIRHSLSAMTKEKRSNRISYFEFVLDPDDFGKTVHNIFHVSFLIRDGRFGLERDEHGLPVLVRLSTAQRDALMKQQENGEIQSQQCVIDLSMPQWKELVELYGIEKPRISERHRPIVSER